LIQAFKRVRIKLGLSHLNRTKLSRNTARFVDTYCWYYQIPAHQYYGSWKYPFDNVYAAICNALISASDVVGSPNRNRNPDRKSIPARTIISSTQKATSIISAIKCMEMVLVMRNSRSEAAATQLLRLTKARYRDSVE